MLFLTVLLVKNISCKLLGQCYIVDNLCYCSILRRNMKQKLIIILDNVFPTLQCSRHRWCHASDADIDSGSGTYVPPRIPADDSSSDSFRSSDEEPLSNIARTSKKATPKRPSYCWRKRQFDPPNTYFTGDVISPPADAIRSVHHLNISRNYNSWNVSITCTECKFV